MQLKNFTNDSRAILDAIRRLVRVLRESSRAADVELGVSGAQLFVLRALASEHTLSINDLAALTLTHQSSVSVVAQTLATRGLVRRTTSPEDGRKVELALTPKGRTLIRGAADAAQERLINGLGQLAKADRRALASGLTKLVDAMGLSDAATPPRLSSQPGLASRPRIDDLRSV